MSVFNCKICLAVGKTRFVCPYLDKLIMGMQDMGGSQSHATE